MGVWFRLSPFDSSDLFSISVDSRLGASASLESLEKCGLLHENNKIIGQHDKWTEQ